MTKTQDYFLLKGIKSDLREVQKELDSIQDIVRELELKLRLDSSLEDENESESVDIDQQSEKIQKAIVKDRLGDIKKPRKSRRKKMSAAARKAVSDRMTRYWAERRKRKKK